MRAIFIAVAFAACVPAIPPAPPPVGHYAVTPVRAEVVADKLSGQWFSREISDERGTAAVELVYCPIVRGQPPVCRTAVVWERDKSALAAAGAP